ncbi:MAG: hypothetical protein R3B84_00920 [Zavarzinella sp.]
MKRMIVIVLLAMATSLGKASGIEQREFPSHIYDLFPLPENRLLIAGSKSTGFTQSNITLTLIDYKTNRLISSVLTDIKVEETQLVFSGIYFACNSTENRCHLLISQGRTKYLTTVLTQHTILATFELPSLKLVSKRIVQSANSIYLHEEGSVVKLKSRFYVTTGNNIESFDESLKNRQNLDIKLAEDDRYISLSRSDPLSNDVICGTANGKITKFNVDWPVSEVKWKKEVLSEADLKSKATLIGLSISANQKFISTTSTFSLSLLNCTSGKTEFVHKSPENQHITCTGEIFEVSNCPHIVYSTNYGIFVIKYGVAKHFLLDTLSKAQSVSAIKNCVNESSIDFFVAIADGVSERLLHYTKDKSDFPAKITESEIILSKLK